MSDQINSKYVLLADDQDFRIDDWLPVEWPSSGGSLVDVFGDRSNRQRFTDAFARFVVFGPLRRDPKLPLCRYEGAAAVIARLAVGFPAQWVNPKSLADCLNDWVELGGPHPLPWRLKPKGICLETVVRSLADHAIEVVTQTANEWPTAGGALRCFDPNARKQFVHAVRLLLTDDDARRQVAFPPDVASRAALLITRLTVCFPPSNEGGRGWLSELDSWIKSDQLHPPLPWRPSEAGQSLSFDDIGFRLARRALSLASCSTAER
ncbi:MAG: hypothetical protein AAF802_07600 [Planctomycetota bacterium]